MPYKHTTQQAISGHTWYMKNKALTIARKNERRRIAAAFIREYKTGKTCIDCQGEWGWYQFDFHHRPGTKKRYALHRMPVHGCSIEKIKVEIAKCDLICSNCHRQRHYEDYKRGAKT